MASVVKVERAKTTASVGLRFMRCMVGGEFRLKDLLLVRECYRVTMCL